jgi:chemotaxis protein CheC
VDQEGMNLVQMDLLKEIANIGTGHSAMALSQMLGRGVDMFVPDVEQIPLEEISSFFGNPELPVCAVLARCDENLPLNLMLIMPESDSRALSEIMLSSITLPSDLGMAEALRESALSEAGNIILGAFISAVGDFMKVELPLSVPAVAHDMLGAILDVIISIFGVTGDTAFLADTRMTIPEEGNRVFSARVFLVPDPDSLGEFMRLLGF